MKNHEIFVCCGSYEGEVLSYLFCEKLTQRGFSVFGFTEYKQLEKDKEEILQVIEKCNDVLVVLNKNSLSDSVAKAISAAITAEKNIIPIVMKDFSFPDVLPDDIVDIKTYNYVTANMEQFDEVFEKTVSMLHSSKNHEVELLKNLNINNELCAEISSVIESISKFNRPEDIYQLGLLYANLNRNELNEEIAGLYKRASERGYTPAQVKLGDCYHEGKGVEKNILTAFSLYCKAGLMGDIDGIYALYRSFEKEHQTIAFKFLMKAFNSNPDDIFLIKKVAEHFEYGLGTPCNYEKAQELYTKAYSLGAQELLYKTKNRYWRKIRIKNLFSD